MRSKMLALTFNHSSSRSSGFPPQVRRYRTPLVARMLRSALACGAFAPSTEACDLQGGDSHVSGGFWGILNPTTRAIPARDASLGRDAESYAPSTSPRRAEPRSSTLPRGLNFQHVRVRQRASASQDTPGPQAPKELETLVAEADWSETSIVPAEDSALATSDLGARWSPAGAASRAASKPAQEPE